MSDALPDRRALVIDDSATARMLLQHYLEGEGFRVVEADDGRAGLSLLQTRGPFDLVLVDWHMRDLGGLDFIVEARKRGFEDLPIMMVTTESSLSSVERAIVNGATEFLMKPFDAFMVRDKLEILGFPGQA